MKNNKLIPYKENIFTKISNFFKKMFFKEKNTNLQESREQNIQNQQQKEYFIENITVKENKEEERLKIIQLKYDNGEIDEEDISDEDMEKLIEMYEKETEELNNETEKIKMHISQMLKELKHS